MQDDIHDSALKNGKQTHNVKTVTNKHCGDVHSKWSSCLRRRRPVGSEKSRTCRGGRRRRAPSRNAPNKIYLRVSGNYFTRIWKQHHWIDIFDTRIWAFESPDSDTRFTKYGRLKFTYLYTNIHPRKTVKRPDLQLGWATRWAGRGAGHPWAALGLGLLGLDRMRPGHIGPVTSPRWTRQRLEVVFLLCSSRRT